MKASERDLELKLRIMRFLWYNGYFVRKNINLPRFSYGERTSEQYTDMDVLSLKIDEDFGQKIIICDCKSGRNVKNTDRILWLSGLMAYMGADKGIFFRTRINETRYFDLAKKLNITPLSLERLSELEKAYNLESKQFIGSFNKDILKIEEEIFKKLKNNSKKVYDYLNLLYWNDIPQKQIKLLINSQNNINISTYLNEKEKLFLHMYILSLLSSSVLKFSQSILIFPNSEREIHIKESLLGEGIEIKERKRLLDSFYGFMSAEIRERYGENYPISKKDFMSQIYPKYSKYLLDLTQRVCMNPIDAIQVPRFLDIIAYEFILNNDRNNLEKKIFSHNNVINLDMTIKLAKDFVVFGNRAGFFSSETYNILNGLLSEIEH